MRRSVQLENGVTAVKRTVFVKITRHVTQKLVNAYVHRVIKATTAQSHATSDTLAVVVKRNAPRQIQIRHVIISLEASSVGEFRSLSRTHCFLLFREFLLNSLFSFHCTLLSPGYVGLTCQHPCSGNTWGPECSNKCNCRNGGECNHVTGTCNCMPGFTGADCKEPCHEGFYGTNCSQTCRCVHGQCRRIDGFCSCSPGFMGSDCNDICPEGYYGSHCIGQCECNANQVCHAVHGCVCRAGFTGANCSEALSASIIDERGELKFYVLKFMYR